MRNTLFLLLLICIINFSELYGQKYEYQLTKLVSDTLISLQPYSNPIFLTFKLSNDADIKIEFYRITDNELANDSLKETTLIKKYFFNNIESGNYLFSWNHFTDNCTAKSGKFLYMIYIDNVLYYRQVFTINKP